METILDHGYVKFVEASGHGEFNSTEDEMSAATDMEPGIIEAARQSTQGSFRGWEEDKKLLGYLFNSVPAHAGPFEFADLVVEVQAPIFVFREWHRHRTQSYNEMSARYAPLPDLNYVPTVARLMLGGGHLTKQAGSIAGAAVMGHEDSVEFQDELVQLYSRDEIFYQKWLQRGASKELARVKLPVGRYSRMRAKANLRNWLAFMTLRYDPAAQWEIQQYAHAVGRIIESVFPRTWSLYRAQRNERAAMAAMWKALPADERARLVRENAVIPTEPDF